MKYINENIVAMKHYISMWKELLENPKTTEFDKRMYKEKIEEFQDFVDIMEKSIPAEKLHEHGEEYRCSRCRAIVLKNQIYCHDCGQKLEVGGR